MICFQINCQIESSLLQCKVTFDNEQKNQLQAGSSGGGGGQSPKHQSVSQSVSQPNWQNGTTVQYVKQRSRVVQTVKHTHTHRLTKTPFPDKKKWRQGKKSCAELLLLLMSE